MSVVVVRRCASCGFSDESPAEDVVMVEGGTDDDVIEAFEDLRDVLISKAGPRPCPTCERPGLDYSAVVRSVTAAGAPNWRRRARRGHPRPVKDTGAEAPAGG